MSGNQQNPTWPAPKFYFSVTIGDVTVPFQEVSGLDTEDKPTEYRAGNNPVFAPTKLPGLKKSSTVTLKQGVMTKSNALWDWFNEVRMNTIKRENVKIDLFDDTGKVSMSWILGNAFPVKVSNIDLKAEGNEVAVESVEIAYESLSFSKT